MKSEQICLDHECEKCGKKLYKSSWKTNLIMMICYLVIMTGVIGSLTWFENKSEKLCYERHYISGRGTDLEVLKNVDVKCPQ